MAGRMRCGFGGEFGFRPERPRHRQRVKEVRVVRRMISSTPRTAHPHTIAANKADSPAVTRLAGVGFGLLRAPLSTKTIAALLSDCDHFHFAPFLSQGDMRDFFSMHL